MFKHAICTVENLWAVSLKVTIPVEDFIEPGMSKDTKDTNTVSVERRIQVRYWSRDSNPERIFYNQCNLRQTGSSVIEGGFVVPRITESQPTEHTRQTFSAKIPCGT